MGLLSITKKVRGHLTCQGYVKYGSRQQYLGFKCDTCGDLFLVLDNSQHINTDDSTLETTDWDELRPSCNGEKITKCPWCS